MGAWARQYAWVRRTGVWISAVAAFAILGGAGLMGVGMTRGGPSGGAGLPLACAFNDAAPPAASPTPSGPAPAQLAKIKRAGQLKALNKAMTAYAKTVPEFSVAVLDQKT